MRPGLAHGYAVMLAAVAVAAAGCASIPADVRALDEGLSSIELESTPFFPQRKYQCGPAALATILAASGRPVSVESLVDRVYLPAREGSLQVELLAATRAAERIPYRIDGTLAAVARELAAGRPVLVLQNLGVSWLPAWHYAVIVGLDAANGTVLLRSGEEPRRLTRVEVFLRSWRRADFWGLVALRPEELPAEPDKERYFRALADAEAVGRSDVARTAWRTAAEHWPDDPLPELGLGNVALAEGRAGTAERHYREAIARDPGFLTAYNNLAYALARQGRKPAAIAALDTALALAADRRDARAALEASRRELAR